MQTRVDPNVRGVAEGQCECARAGSDRIGVAAIEPQRAGRLVVVEGNRAGQRGCNEAGCFTATGRATGRVRERPVAGDVPRAVRRALPVVLRGHRPLEGDHCVHVASRKIAKHDRPRRVVRPVEVGLRAERRTFRVGISEREGRKARRELSEVIDACGQGIGLRGPAAYRSPVHNIAARWAARGPRRPIVERCDRTACWQVACCGDIDRQTIQVRVGV